MFNALYSYCLLSFELNWLIILGCFFRVPFLAKMRAAPIMSRFNFLVAELSPIYLSLDLRFKGGTPIPELFSLFTVLRYARLSPAFFRSSSSSRNICIFLICCLSCGECLNRLMIVWRAMRPSASVVAHRMHAGGTAIFGGACRLQQRGTQFLTRAARLGC